MKRDKVYHIVAGFLIAAFCGFLTAPAVGLLAGIAAGAAKELYDLTGRGTPSWGDFIATLMGAALGAGVSAL